MRVRREKGGLLARLRALRALVTSREAEEAELQAHVARLEAAQQLAPETDYYRNQKTKFEGASDRDE